MKTINILLVEDNEGDIVLTTEALQTAAETNNIIIARDGHKAMLYLNEAENKKHLPDLILLDINLPRMNGHEVLRSIKGNSVLKHIPVVMLSTSSSQKDIDSSYQNHANCYITKPNDIHEFFNIIEKLENFWSSTAQLPDKQKTN